MNPGRTIPRDAAERLTVAAEPYLSCDDCFDRVDTFVEGLLAGRDADGAPMRAHLEGCSACGEEAVSLLLLVAADRGIDPEPALRRLGTPV